MTAEAGAARTRKGYNRRADIPPPLLRRLNRGEEEPLTLAEWLAIDAVALLRAVLPQAGLARHARGILAAARVPQGVMERHRAIGAALFRAAGSSRSRVFEKLAAHPSGMVREWAAMMLTADPALTIEQRIEAARRFAADHSMNVREIAWSSYRPYLAADLERALRKLAAWVRDPDPNIRRCAVESTRPRGVWCAHLTAMKERPDLGLPLLEPVRADSSRYVQLAVANWINDASKSDAAWAKRLCARWRRESPCPATEAIVQRALRTVRKASR